MSNQTLEQVQELLGDGLLTMVKTIEKIAAGFCDYMLNEQKEETNETQQTAE